MSVRFVLTSKTKVDVFRDTASLNDVIKYEFDLTPWQDDNATVTSVTWTVESGEASIASAALASGVASALVTLNQAGKALISLLINTASVKKKIWLEIGVKDLEMPSDDYGFTA